MLIDQELPRWERRVLVSLPVEADSLATFAAIRRVDFLRSPVIAVPNRLRTWFDAFFRSREHRVAAQPKHFGIDELLGEQGGFHLLAEEAGEELVLGFIGRWWDRGYGRVEWSADEFRDFSRPGYGVGAWGFTVLRYGASATVLVTDVRVRCTDEEARRSFQRYWSVVGPFVAAMGRPVLQLIRKEAERATKSMRGNPHESQR
jgi:hypothetical protein